MDDTGSSLTSLVESNNVFKISSSVGSRDCWCAVKLLERQQSIIEGGSAPGAVGSSDRVCQCSRLQAKYIFLVYSIPVVYTIAH